MYYAVEYHVTQGDTIEVTHFNDIDDLIHFIRVSYPAVVFPGVADKLLPFGEVFRHRVVRVNEFRIAAVGRVSV